MITMVQQDICATNAPPRVWALSSTHRSTASSSRPRVSPTKTSPSSRSAIGQVTQDFYLGRSHIATSAPVRHWQSVQEAGPGFVAAIYDTPQFLQTRKDFAIWYFTPADQPKTAPAPSRRNRRPHLCPYDNFSNPRLIGWHFEVRGELRGIEPPLPPAQTQLAPLLSTSPPPPATAPASSGASASTSASYLPEGRPTTSVPPGWVRGFGVRRGIGVYCALALPERSEHGADHSNRLAEEDPCMTGHTQEPPFVASFGASTVEFVEATTIVLAVGSVRGWKGALWGAVFGVATLSVLVLALGPALALVPMHLLQIIIGILLLLFGMRWLRKAVLRAAGVIGLHDEEKIYAKQTAALRAAGEVRRGWDALAVATCFKAVVLEGLEVVFIVIAVGATGHTLGPACIGAVVAGVMVLTLAVAVHRPLARVPENTLKYGVGVMLAAFGVFLGGGRLRV